MRQTGSLNSRRHSQNHDSSPCQLRQECRSLRFRRGERFHERVEIASAAGPDCSAFIVEVNVCAAAIAKFPSCCDQLRRPTLYECSEAVKRLGEIVSGGGKAQAEMRRRIEAIAGSEQDST